MSLISDGELILNRLNAIKVAYGDLDTVHSVDFMRLRSFIYEAVRTLKSHDANKEPAPAADTLTFQDSLIGAFSGKSNFTSEAKPSAHAQPLPEPREAISAFSYLISLRNALRKEGIRLEFTISSDAPIVKFANDIR